MPRISRMVINDQRTVYHVMSRTALDGFPIKDVEKDFMLDLMKRFSTLYFTEILGFCLMDNHFHLLVKMILQDRFMDLFYDYRTNIPLYPRWQEAFRQYSRRCWLLGAKTMKYSSHQHQAQKPSNEICRMQHAILVRHAILDAILVRPNQLFEN